MGALPYTRYTLPVSDSITSLLRRKALPPRTNHLSRPPAVVTAPKKTQQRYASCLAHAVRSVFFSVVANRRQPNLYINIFDTQMCVDAALELRGRSALRDSFIDTLPCPPTSTSPGGGLPGGLLEGSCGRPKRRSMSRRRPAGLSQNLKPEARAST